jgi:predicted regulator of Ras-like GTPase activity (Roadblock/LC7/MglB family)
MTSMFELAALGVSVAGAFLFLAAGFFLARFRAGARPVPEAIEPREEQEAQESGQAEEPGAMTLDEILRENAQLKQANEQHKEENRAIYVAARGRLVKLKGQLDQAVSERGELKGRLEKAGQMVRELNQEKARLAEELRRLEQIGQESGDGPALAELEQRNRELALKCEKLDKQMRYVAELEDSNRELRFEVERLEEEFTRLSDLEGANLELSIRAQRLDEQQKDLESVREENRNLMAALSEMDVVRREYERLQKENARLTSMGIILGRPAFQVSIPAVASGLGGTFRNIVERLSVAENSRGVVLADDLGLLVAGTGEHTEPMAAMAAVFSTVTQRMETIFPIGQISQIVIENADELTITMQPYEIGPDKLILTSLSVGPGPGRKDVVGLIEDGASASSGVAQASA